MTLRSPAFSGRKADICSRPSRCDQVVIGLLIAKRFGGATVEVIDNVSRTHSRETSCRRSLGRQGIAIGQFR